MVLCVQNCTAFNAILCTEFIMQHTTSAHDIKYVEMQMIFRNFYAVCFYYAVVSALFSHRGPNSIIIQGCESSDFNLISDFFALHKIKVLDFKCIEKHILSMNCSGISDLFRLFLTYPLTPLS